MLPPVQRNVLSKGAQRADVPGNPQVQFGFGMCPSLHRLQGCAERQAPRGREAARWVQNGPRCSQRPWPSSLHCQGDECSPEMLSRPRPPSVYGRTVIQIHISSDTKAPMPALLCATGMARHASVTPPQPLSIPPSYPLCASPRRLYCIPSIQSGHAGPQRERGAQEHEQGTD